MMIVLNLKRRFCKVHHCILHLTNTDTEIQKAKTDLGNKRKEKVNDNDGLVEIKLKATKSKDNYFLSVYLNEVTSQYLLISSP